MYSLTNRQLSILYCLLDRKTCVTSEQLADFSASSVRTIKSEITKLNDLLIDEGVVHIVATSGQGYELEILMDSKFDELDNRIKSEYSFYKKYGVEKMSRRLHIIQRLLSSEYVKMDDVADELYLSKSAIKYDITWVSEFLASYDIQVASRANKGSYLVGDERNIRNAMVETFCSQYFATQSDYDVPVFKEEFYSDYDYYQEIRHALLKLLRESKYSTKDISTKKISTYIVLIRKRIRDGKDIHISKKEKQELKDSYEVELAKAIVAIPNLFEETIISEDELYYLAILLICKRDVDLMDKNDQETIHKQFFGETVKGYEKIIEELKANKHDRFFKMELFDRFRNHLLSSLYSLYVCTKYHQNEYQHLSTYFEIADFEFSPYGIELSRRFLMIAEKVFHTSITHTDIDHYIVLFELILKRINLDYKKRRIAMISLAGRSVAREYKELIMERFNNFVEYIHVFNQYEMRRINFDDYDITFVDGSKFGNYYPIEFVTYRILSLENSTMQLFESAFIKGYSTEMIEYLQGITTVYPNFECSSYSILFKMLSFKYGGVQAQAFEAKLRRNEAMYSFYNPSSMVALIMVDYEVSQRSFVDVYVSENKMQWDQSNEVKYIIAVSLANDVTMVQVKTINKILHVLCTNLKMCQDLCSDMEATYAQIFENVIHTHFMRT